MPVSTCPSRLRGRRLCRSTARDPGGSLAGERGVDARGLRGCGRRTGGGGQGPPRKEKGGICTGAERVSSTHSLSSPPGYFLESCISVATLGADTWVGLSAEAGRGSGFLPRGRWPRGTRGSPVPAGGGSGRLASSPNSAPQNRAVSAQGHILPRRRSCLLPPITTPPSSSPHSVCVWRRGRGAMPRGRFSGPFWWAFETASK